MNDEVLFHAVGLAKGFGDTEVLRGLDLSIRQGQVFGLLGSNGAGKTTAINILIGLLHQDRGEVLVGGPHNDRDWSKRIGVAPQDIALYPKLSCSENLSFFGRIYGLSGGKLEERVDHVVSLLGLTGHRHARAATLSGGIRRRLNLAVAMIHDPALLILDEPTTGLDIEARFGLWDLIPRLRDSGTGILLTTHLLDEAAALCDRIGLLHEGRIVREGTLEELCSSMEAVQVAEIVSDNETLLLRRVDSMGLSMRRQGARHLLMLPERTNLEFLVDMLSGTEVRSVSLRPVGLEDVYLAVTQNSTSAVGGSRFEQRI